VKVIEAPEYAPPALADLCDQQFWLFGRDIHHHEGNLLLEAGFERWRAGSGRPTQYVFDGSSNSVGLWGFGLVWISHDKGRSLFVSRDGEFTLADVSVVPKIREPWKAGRRLNLAGQPEPDAVSEVCGWFADYETWVIETAGLDHRRAALDDWDSCCEADQTIAGWMAHAERIQTGG
jgi:hypothetical protein